MNAKKFNQVIKTHTGRIIQAALFEPAPKNFKEPEGDKAYILKMSFDKKDPETAQLIEKVNAAFAYFFPGMNRKFLKSCLTDGDERADYLTEMYAADEPQKYNYMRGTVTLKAQVGYPLKSTQRMPKVLRGPLIDGRLQPCEPEAMYAGCFGKAEIYLFSYEVQGNRGIAASINTVVKVRDGERLGRQSSDLASDWGNESEFSSDGIEGSW